MKDLTLDGIHLCNVRLRLLRMNTMPAFNPDLLADVSQLQQQKSAELRDLGRLPYPMMRQRGGKGFRRVSWDEALQVISEIAFVPQHQIASASILPVAAPSNICITTKKQVQRLS